jgi:hypothetical protein
MKSDRLRYGLLALAMILTGTAAAPAAAATADAPRITKEEARAAQLATGDLSRRADRIHVGKR